MAQKNEKLFLIGKSQNPRAFNISVNKLPVVWKSFKKARMTLQKWENG